MDVIKKMKNLNKLEKRIIKIGVLFLLCSYPIFAAQYSKSENEKYQVNEQKEFKETLSKVINE
jgi:hypothetical protein